MKAAAIIKQIEAKYLKSDVPRIYIGDTIKVGVKIVEGARKESSPTRAL